ncbi:hypothetical protein [Corallococcus aberystwythensis]|uniref:Nmad2 family putative nucleotide modification protein n=1 Tax=Corallococcus aberystwythensis TaxID=2316722 RepID=UPI0011C35F9D|nr:hypothetical protein [Corallococcus aberystwythensis]
MKLYSYVVARDYGFAPNPFFGYGTLATCKPRIRKGARVGDWVIGTGATDYELGSHLIYAMRVGETLTFDQYWKDTRFRMKRPNLQGSLKQAFGDNIYHHSAGGAWCQERSHHSHRNGQLNRANLANDTRVDRVLVADWFVYFGASAVKVPEEFRKGKRETILRGGRDHLVNYLPGFAESVVGWIHSLGRKGLEGEPLEFSKELSRVGTTDRGRV